MRVNQLVRCRDGTNRHIVKLDDVEIPDLYKVGEKLHHLLQGKSVLLSRADVSVPGGLQPVP